MSSQREDGRGLITPKIGPITGRLEPLVRGTEPRISVHPTYVDDDRRVRVATYNIRHGAPPGRPADLRGIAAAVSSLHADVVALQEVDRRVIRTCFADQAMRLGRSAGLTAHFAPARRFLWTGSYGNALLFRGTAARLERVSLASVGEQRVALIASVQLHEQQVTVVSTHLQNSRRGRQSEAGGQLDEILGVLHKWPRPWVLMGDLNLRPEVVLPRLERAGLHPVSTAPTFPSHAPRICIDWIAVAGLELLSAEVVDLRASDHRPIVAELVPSADGSGGSGGGAPTAQVGVEESAE